MSTPLIPATTPSSSTPRSTAPHRDFVPPPTEATETLPASSVMPPPLRRQSVDSTTSTTSSTGSRRTSLSDVQPQPQQQQQQQQQQSSSRPSSRPASRRNSLSQEPPFKGRQIMVLVDGSENADHAFLTAVSWKRPQDVLHIVHCVELIDLKSPFVVGFGGMPTMRSPKVFSESNNALMNEAADLIRQYADRCAELKITNIKACVAPSDQLKPKDRAIQYAKDHFIDVIYLAAQAMNPLVAMFIGSFAQAVVSGAPCDVVLVRPREDFLKREQRVVEQSRLEDSRKAIREKLEAQNVPKDESKREEEQRNAEREIQADRP